MGNFGWDYPAGAANDPNAPYNQPDEPEDCTVCSTVMEQSPDGLIHYTVTHEEDERGNSEPIVTCLDCDEEFICKVCKGQFHHDDCVDPAVDLLDRICTDCQLEIDDGEIE